MASITINGVIISGGNITIRNGKVLVDGKDHTPDGKEINIQVDGNINYLDVEHAEEVKVKGDVVNLKTMSGSVSVLGNVQGSVKTMSGSVECGNVEGGVSTMSGDVKHRS